MRFGAGIARRDDRVLLDLNGDLDEEATLPELAPGPPRLTIDLGGIRLINSMGCRRWVTWIAALADTFEEIELERCGHAVIQQLNIFGGFLPARTKITSFFVPYECPTCQHAARVLHQHDHAFTEDSVPEHLPCAACGGRMNIDVLRPQYFKFTASA